MRNVLGNGGLLVPERVALLEEHEAEQWFAIGVCKFLTELLRDVGVPKVHMTGSYPDWSVQFILGSGREVTVAFEWSDIGNLRDHDLDFRTGVAAWLVRRLHDTLSAEQEPSDALGLNDGVLVDGRGTAVKIGSDICEAMGPARLERLQARMRGEE